MSLQATNQPRNNFRIRYVINKRFQLRFVFFMNFVALLVITIFYAANMLFFQDLRLRALDRGVGEDHIFLKFLDLQAENLNRIFGATSFLILMALSILGILYSHRIAGPLYRLTKHFNAISSGQKPGPVYFRKGDFFQEIPEAYNRHLGIILKNYEHNKPPANQVTQDQKGLKSAL